MKFLVLILITSLLISCESNKEKHLGLQLYGSFSPSLADSISSTITKVYGFKVSVLTPIEIPQSSFVNHKSPRYRADKLIKILKEQKPDSLNYIMALTNKDISTTKKDKYGNTRSPASKYEDWGIFGLAYCPGKSSIVSSFRYQNTTPNKFIDRLRKICTHELGHNLGLKHCPDKNCVMTDAAETINTIDNVNLELCSECLKKMN